MNKNDSITFKDLFKIIKNTTIEIDDENFNEGSNCFKATIELEILDFMIDNDLDNSYMDNLNKFSENCFKNMEVR